MNHRDIQDGDIVARYVMGRLSDEELDRFETHFLDCHQCQSEIRQASLFHRALKSASDTDSADRDYPVPAWPTGPSRPGRMARIVAVAAVLALAIVGVVFVRESVRWRTLMDEKTSAMAAQSAQLAQLREPRVNPPSIFLEARRHAIDESQTPANVLSLAPENKGFRLTLQGRFPKNHKFRLRLLDAADEIVWQEADVIPNRDGQFDLVFPGSFVSAGRFVLVVDMSNGADFTHFASFGFDLRRPTD